MWCDFVLFVQHDFVMGRNRKFVLEDDLQQAVWRTILRGPRPPSAKWGRSSPAESKPGSSKQAQPGNVKKSEVKAPKQFGQSSTTPRVSRSPEEVVAAARSRVVKLRSVLATLGDDDKASATIKAALQKAEVQAQERPILEQIKSTQLYIGRKRVEQARQAVISCGNPTRTGGDVGRRSEAVG